MPSGMDTALLKEFFDHIGSGQRMTKLSGDGVCRCRADASVVARFYAPPTSRASFADAVADHTAKFHSRCTSPLVASRRNLRHARFRAGDAEDRACPFEQIRRKLTDAMQYPAFVLVAASGVMLFFLLFVLPQFSSVLGDFGSKVECGARRLHRSVGFSSAPTPRRRA